jgi:hypothetical protein
MDIDNVGFNQCVNFQIEIRCILPSVKITKTQKMTKSRSQCTVHHCSLRTKSRFVIFTELKIQRISF